MAEVRRALPGGIFLRIGLIILAVPQRSRILGRGVQRGHCTKEKCWESFLLWGDLQVPCVNTMRDVAAPSCYSSALLALTV